MRTKGIGRNALCWCGSGRKYKKCHLNREFEEPLGHQDIIEKHRAAASISDRSCLHPEAPENCTGKAIRSHSITRSGGLDEIAENGHVKTFFADYGVFLRTQGDVEATRLGIHKASVFPAFCAHHDSSTFRPIEKEPYYPCQRHAFLTSYRALCHELFLFGVKAQDDGLADLDRGLPIEAQFIVQQMAAAKREEARLGLIGLNQFKRDYDAALLEQDFSRMQFYAVEFSSAPDAMVSSMFSPSVDFQGVRIRDGEVLGTQNDHMFVSLFASASKGWFQLAWLGDSNAGLRFTRSFAALSDEQIPHAIVRLVFSHFGNLYFRPSWWAGLAEEERKCLHRRYWNPANPHRLKEDCYLQDDGQRLVKWQVKARTAKFNS